MRVLCISASNTKLMGENSASTKVCNLIKDIFFEKYGSDFEVNIIPLMDYDLHPCFLCGNCYKDEKCIYDEDFNKIYNEICNSDAVFLVVPHYSTIPSKLTMIFEKINEILYASWINNPNYKSLITQKPICIIGHGGIGENTEVLNYYHENLVTPIANTLRSLSFKVIGLDDNYVNGAVFGLEDNKCIKKVEDKIFPLIIHNYDLIKERISPLIYNVYNELK